KNYISYFIGKIVHCERPRWLAKLIKEQFAKVYKIDVGQAEFTLDQYPSLGLLFTRKLKTGLRPIQGDVVHCADSRISQAAKIDDDILIQAKGKFFRLGKLLNKSRYTEKFQNGYFVTYYLCPTDYHR